MKEIKILPENMVNGEHVLTQEMLNKADTIFIANFDYIIEASDLRLPYGSELRIDGGSISGQPIFMPSSNADSLQAKEYAMLLVGPHVSKEKLSENDSKITYLLSGSILKSYGVRSFSLTLYGDCRIALPAYGNGDDCLIDEGQLNVVSIHEYTIQIDGKTELSLNAENCTFQRIFECSGGFSFVNRSNVSDLRVIFTNCKVWAYDNGVTYDSSIMPITVGTSSRCTGNSRLILRDCVLENIGVIGELYIDNCKFIFGNNVNYNNESVHCASHSRILNSVFDGRGMCASTNISKEDVECEFKLNADVIDVFNGHDIVIENCTFVNYIDETNSGACLITIKSHYIYGGRPDEGNQEEDSHRAGKGQQIGVTVRDCFFDLPNFKRNIIEVWNGVRNMPPNEDRTLNRQCTNIESNFIKAPNATFVACLCFSDHTRVCNNSGQVNKLIYVRDDIKYTGTDENESIEPDKYQNLTHDLIICDNILAYYGQNPENTPIMTILYGCSIDNLVLSGNKTNGYIWNGLFYDNVENLSGTVRVIDNETYGSRGIFNIKDRILAKIPSCVNFFLSGNVSRGYKLDEGTLDEANTPTDGVLFVGRQFFCTSNPYRYKLLVYDGENWVKA